MWPFVFILAALGSLPLSQSAKPAAAAPPSSPIIEEIAQSGRCADLGDTPDQQVAPAPEIAPGPPPLLSFRYYEGKLHHRYGNADLMLDDAGH
jgi:hypothetical protein